MNDHLKHIKKSLEEALGPDNFAKYLKLLRKWFASDLSKVQFDNEARKLVSDGNVNLHNELFVAILTKCNISASTSSMKGPKKRKGLEALRQLINKSSSRVHEKRFRASEPMQPSAQLMVQSSQSVQDHHRSNLAGDVTICTKDGLLPDRSTLFGRALLIAWESGMEEINEQSVDLVVLAIRDLLKNVMHSAIQLRRNFVVSPPGFPHLFGADASLTSTDPSSSESALLACSTSPECISTLRSKPVNRITLRDIYEGLTARPIVLPCQTVSAVIMERILCKLGNKD